MLQKQIFLVFFSMGIILYRMSVSGRPVMTGKRKLLLDWSWKKLTEDTLEIPKIASTWSRGVDTMLC